MKTNERGAILAIVIMAAVVFAIAAFALLTITLSSRKQARDVHQQRVRAHYAAEAGLVWAMQRLWVNPAYCGSPGPPQIDGMTVTVTVSNCGAGNVHTLQATVSY